MPYTSKKGSVSTPGTMVVSQRLSVNTRGTVRASKRKAVDVPLLKHLDTPLPSLDSEDMPEDDSINGLPGGEQYLPKDNPIKGPLVHQVALAAIATLLGQNFRNMVAL
jgi:hypothetical protein